MRMGCNVCTTPVTGLSGSTSKFSLKALLSFKALLSKQSAQTRTKWPVALLTSPSVSLLTSPSDAWRLLEVEHCSKYSLPTHLWQLNMFSGSQKALASNSRSYLPPQNLDCH